MSSLAKTRSASPPWPTVAESASTHRAEGSTVPSDLGHCHVMATILLSFFGDLGSALRIRGDLVLENLALCQQLAVFKRRDPRPHLIHPDRLFWIALSRVWSRWRETMVLVKPETVVGWHRWAFRRFWTWRSRMGKIVELPEVGGLHHRYERLAA